MIVLVIAACITACILMMLAAPLVRDAATRKSGITIVAAGAVMTMAVYLLLGSPDLPTRAALFEAADTPRAQIRLMQQEELVLLQALSGDPDNTGLLLRLGTLQIESGRPRDAIAHLARARDLKRGDSDIQIALAAAHFTYGLQIASEDKPGATDAGRKEMETALTIAPRGHPLRADIQRAISSIQPGH